MAAAKESFKTLYGEKTGNPWGTTSFVKRPGKFYPLDIDYGQEESSVAALGASAGSTSKLATQIQDLIRLIFDVESMKKAMLEFEVKHSSSIITCCSHSIFLASAILLDSSLLLRRL